MAAVDLAPDAETGEIMSPLAAFLTHASLEAGDNQAQAGQDALQLMSVHAAKGLEFDAVFITGLEEGLFPHENSQSDLDGLEEERRLMYVAITRARKRLYISHSQTRMLHGQTRYHVKSRFIDELPEESLKWITPRNQGFGSGFPARLPGGVGARQWQRLDGRRRAQRGAPAPPPLVPKAPSHGLRTGQGVFHNKFGEGVVDHARRAWRGCARPGQFRPPRHEVAGAVDRQADADRLILLPDSAGALRAPVFPGGTVSRERCRRLHGTSAAARRRCHRAVRR